MAQREQQIQQEILLGLTQRYHKSIRIWRANTGKAMIANRMIAFGVPGQADISGVMRGGYRLEIEVKRPGCTLGSRQRRYRDMIQEMGGIYILAFSLEEAIRDLEHHAAIRGVCL